MNPPSYPEPAMPSITSPLSPGLRRIPAEFAKDAHHWLILHGRYVCQARKPRCRACAVADCCDFDGKTDQA